jgi:hypothetical protein
VLGDDSGYPYCIFWNSTGLDTIVGDSVPWSGSWKVCTSGSLQNIANGKGYFIWSLGSGTYRLDAAPSVAGNVTANHVDIALDPNVGWTMISNPYNAIIELQDVKVTRDDNMNGTIEESEIYTFSDAVSNGWIEPAIYEYEGSVSGYISKAFNGSPPATLDPWVGYFIYVRDITVPTTLRVYMPVQ